MQYSDTAVTTRTAFAAIVLLVSVGACSDSTSSNPGEGNVALENSLRSGLIVSAALPRRFGTMEGGNASDSQVVYVCMWPGVLSGVDSVVVEVSNLPLTKVSADLSHGGFDPLGLFASAGDSLDVSAFVRGAASTIRVSIPIFHAPIVLRTNPSSGDENVQLGQQISMVFSQPIDASTATPSSIRLSEDSIQAATTVQLVADEPWIVALSSIAPLFPNSRYDVVIGSAVADVAHEPLEEPVHFHFSTKRVPVAIDRATAERSRPALPPDGCCFAATRAP